MFGVDTCGFSGNSDEELCNRWMQLSAFFPFYRNHNTIGAASQEPYIWASVAAATKTAATIRYTLLPYIYTTFFLAHTTGSTVMRALAWEFPNDPSLAAADRQFLLGPSLMIVPVLAQGANSVNGVFPGLSHGELWYDWYTQTAVSARPFENISIPAPLGHIPLYIRGGAVLPIQEPGLTTKASRSNPWGLIVASSKQGTASGSLYVDDGESLVQNATLWVDFSLTGRALYASARGTFADANALANVTVLGVGGRPESVKLNGDEVQGWSWDEKREVLEVRDLQAKTAEGAWTEDWVLRW